MSVLMLVWGWGVFRLPPPPRFACYLQLVVLVGILTTSIA